MNEVEKYIGKSKMTEKPKRRFSFIIGNKAITSNKIDDEAVTPDKINRETYKVIQKMIDAAVSDIKQQIHSLSLNGIALSDKLGNSEDIGITQKTITNSINQLWKKLSDITGETSVGLHVTVTPDVFVNEGSAEITINANAGDGIFEALKIYINDALFVDKDNIKTLTVTTELNKTSVIRTVATILGMDYEDVQTVTKVYPFFIGCGQEYTDIINEQNARTYNGDLTGSYDIIVENEGDRIFVVIPTSIRDQIRKINIGGELVPAITMNNFAIPMEVINVDVYTIYRSLNQYQRGIYNIDIN